MDPNETLRQLRQLVKDMAAIVESDEDPQEPGEYYRIASEATFRFDELDGWLSRGGFPPGDWMTGGRS